MSEQCGSRPPALGHVPNGSRVSTEPSVTRRSCAISLIRHRGRTGPGRSGPHFPVRVEACQACLHPPATGLPAVTAASRHPEALFIERSLIAPGRLTRHRRCPRRLAAVPGPPGKPRQCPSPQPGPGPAPDRLGPRRVAARGRAAGQHRRADHRQHAGRRHRRRRPRARQAGRRGGRPDRRLASAGVPEDQARGRRAHPAVAHCLPAPVWGRAATLACMRRREYA
jgi:hypothetical protein